MKRTLTLIFISLIAACAIAQDLYIGTFYVTTTDEEKLYGDGGDKWENRQTAICDMFNFEQPDVLGLQSMTETQFANICKRMTSYVAAEDILYNKNAIQLDTCGLVSEMPEGSTCSWAKLQKDGNAFYVFNVCFPTNTSVGKTAATRVITAIGEINTDGLPCLIVGDLGSDETKAPYTQLNAQYLDSYKKSPVVSAEYGTRNNFDLAANHSSERYDFIFASTAITIRAYGQLQYAYYTKDSSGSYKRRLPSTHFPVMAKVTLPQ
ncbi:MAG: hypothetical protein J5671_01745 [Bacteroidaceae bacterium]|nr:hypothetical protein [Bacteroidaceae bacterium]